MSMTTSLQSVLAATTDALREHPEAGQHHVEVVCGLSEASSVEGAAREHAIRFDQPVPFGADQAPTPGEALLLAVGACQAQVYRFWSEKLGVVIDRLRIEVGGDLDVRRLFGADEDVRAGFEGVRIDVHVSGPEPAERYEELRRIVDEHCPMLDVVANPVPVRTTMHAA